MQSAEIYVDDFKLRAAAKHPARFLSPIPVFSIHTKADQGRDQVENYIAGYFNKTHHASIRHFMPLLFSIRCNNHLSAAAGLRSGSTANFFNQLQKSTETMREELFSVPIICAGLSGEVSLDEYVAFLIQAYHHVKHTVPLLMSTGARLGGEYEWLRSAVAEYIEEEIGHQEWILNDIAACGFNTDSVPASQPAMATELMVSHAYDTISRVNPLGFFGMVHVLEGTSVSLADNAADKIRTSLRLPKTAFSYLYSHGSLDQEHVQFFATLMNRLQNPADQRQIIHSALIFYKLYADIFRTLTPDHGLLQLEGAA